MKTFRITYKDSEGNKQTINITANSEEEARDKFAGQFPNASVDTLETSLFTETEGAEGALGREQIEEERALGGIFQRGFLEGLGIDPDAPVQGATSRFFRDFAPIGQNILRFGSLMNPQTFENVDQETGQLNQIRLGDLARNLGASIGTGPQGILGRARSTFSDLQNLARQGAPTSPQVMDALNPFFQASGADPEGTRRMENLYNLGMGAALDKYGRFLGSDLIPRQSTIFGRFASAPQEQREAGFFDFLQRQLGLN